MEENEEKRRSFWDELPIYMFILLQLATYFKFVSIKMLHHYSFIGFDDLVSLILRSRIPRHGMVQFDFALALYIMEFAFALLVCETNKISVKMKIVIILSILVFSLPYINIYWFLK